MSTATARRRPGKGNTPQPRRRNVYAPPYTWAGHQWNGASSMMAPLIGAAAVAFIGALIHHNHVPWWIVMPAGALLVMAGVGTVAGEKFCTGLQLYMIGFAVLAAGWTSWLSVDLSGLADWLHGRFGWDFTMESTVGLFGLPTFATLTAFGTWPAVRNAQIRHESKIFMRKVAAAGGLAIGAGGEEPAVVDHRSPRARYWEELFERLGKRGVEFVEERALEENIAVRMRLPQPGGQYPAIPYSTVAGDAFAELLEQTIEGLRPGAVRVERAKAPGGQDSSREFWLHLDYMDILAKIIDMPDEHGPTSINDAFRIGRYQDGEWLCLTLREVHGMIVAATREGKSNLLHAIIHQVTRCYDAAIWMIDLKGGATARPWLMPWVEGKTKRPVLDWVAIDRWESARILLAAIDIVRDRPHRRKGSKTEPARAGMRMANGQIAQHDRPAIILLCDEVAELVGAHSGPAMSNAKTGFTSGALGKLVTSLVCLGAGEAVWGLFAGQRQTADMFGSPSAQKQLRLKIAIGAMDPQDAQAVFGNLASTAARIITRLVHKGSGVVWKAGIGKLLAAKICFMGDDVELDERCYDAAVRHTPIVATVETDRYAYRKACEWGYADRWTDRDRIGWLYSEDGDLDEEGGVSDWESVPLPLDSQLQPIRLSEWKAMQAAKEAARVTPSAPAPAQQGATMTETGPDDQPTPPGTGFWPTAKPTPPQQPAPPAPDGPIETNPEAVDAMIAGFEQMLANPAASPPADDDSGPLGDDSVRLGYDKVQRTAMIIDRAGPAGITAADLIAQMIAEGILPPKGYKGYRRIVTKAMADGGLVDPDLKIEQPGGKGNRYYTVRQRRRPAA